MDNDNVQRKRPKRPFLYRVWRFLQFLAMGWEESGEVHNHIPETEKEVLITEHDAAAAREEILVQE